MDRQPFSLMDFLLSFEGRIGRMGYWAYTLAVFVAVFLFAFAFGLFDTMSAGPVAKGAPADDTILMYIFLTIVFVGYMWTNYAVHAKRWHDRDKSGWWSLIGLIPYIGGIWVLVECGFLKGTDGPNQYGEDPRGGNLVEVFE